MNMYHRASGLFNMSVKHDWTTDDGIVAGLQQELKIVGYGTVFQIYRDRTLLDEDTVRQAIIEAVTGPAMMLMYKETLRRMIGAGDEPNHYEADVQADANGLVFEHGDFKRAIDLATGLRIAGPGEKKTKREKTVEEKAKALEQKREKIQDTDEENYLTHAAQCGYLLRNVRLGFLRSPKMQGTSVKMRINNLTLDQLQRFIDATGSPTLAALSTHEGTQPGADDSGRYIYSGWIGFAMEVIDFLNLEMVIDVEELKARHRDIGGDTGGRTLETWDADAEIVIGQLADRRPDIDAEAIREWFMEGYGGALIMDTDQDKEAA